VKRRPSAQRLRRLAGRCRTPAGDIPAELWWRLRYHAALRAACYLTIRIDQPHLRMRVVEHLAVCWWRSCANGGHPNGLDGLFRDYCRDVERDVDPKPRDTTWELHRVWTNHAVLLGGELDEVCSRP
jgi:hypothetical protein